MYISIIITKYRGIIIVFSINIISAKHTILIYKEQLLFYDPVLWPGIVNDLRFFCIVLAHFFLFNVMRQGLTT